MSFINSVWKKLDVDRVDELIGICNISDDELIKYIQSAIRYDEVDFYDIDVVACVYDIALLHATHSIFSYSNGEIDLSKLIHVSPNYLNTTFELDVDKNILEEKLCKIQNIMDWDETVTFVLDSVGIDKYSIASMVN